MDENIFNRFKKFNEKDFNKFLNKYVEYEKLKSEFVKLYKVKEEHKNGKKYKNFIFNGEQDQLEKVLKEIGILYNGMNKNETIDWIKTGPDYNKINKTKLTGLFLEYHDISTRKIRSIFGKIKKIESKLSLKSIPEILMLIPLTSYNIARASNKQRIALERLYYEVIKPSVEFLNNNCENKENFKKYFKNFVNLYESILSFHKYYGGE